jgi:Protein of unknown function (DUF2782)
VRLFLLLFILLSCCSSLAQPAAAESGSDDIEIVEGEDRTIYEYRNNGILVMIKVVPKVGRPYYMVPADGTAHYEDLDFKKDLYPQWVILEW